MISIIEENTRKIWDERRWMLAQKADNPVEAYNSMVEQDRILNNSTPIDELPQEQQDWLRRS